MKNEEDQIAKNNVSKLIRGEFDFNPKKILNKIIFDTKKLDGEITMDMIIDVLNDETNDGFYVEHPVGSNYFALKQESGR